MKLPEQEKEKHGQTKEKPKKMTGIQKPATEKSTVTTYDL